VELLDLGPEQLEAIAEKACEVYQEIRKSYA
jgi:hypothetical protein